MTKNNRIIEIEQGYPNLGFPVFWGKLDRSQLKIYWNNFNLKINIQRQKNPIYYFLLT